MKLTKKQWAALEELKSKVSLNINPRAADWAYGPDLNAHLNTLDSLIEKGLIDFDAHYPFNSTYFCINQKGIEALKNHI